MIFLDCGSHEGQTLCEVLRPEYPFIQIHGFEPFRENWQELVRNYVDPRLRIHNFGLLDRTGKARIYGPNHHGGASVYRTKNDIDGSEYEYAHFQSASAFVNELDDLPIVLKLNCEGSEIPIVNNLIESGKIWRIKAMMIDFDIRKVPDQAHEEKRLLGRLACVGYKDFMLCDDVMKGPTHQARIANWLHQPGVIW